MQWKMRERPMVSVVIDKKSTKRKWIVILCELSMKQNRIAEKKKTESNDKKILSFTRPTRWIV